MNYDIANQIQLITYADSLGGSLPAMEAVIREHFPGAFAAIHILPPYPSSGDRGFAPVDYTRIDARFGSWADVEKLAKAHEIVLDIMVNHMSRQSAAFQDFLNKGEASPYRDFFLTPQKIWGADAPPADDLKKIVLRRPCPWSDYPGADGKSVRIWTTFGKDEISEQVDLDVNNPEVRGYFEDLFKELASHGVSMIRLDAVGYVTKRPGTSFFFVEPEIYEFLFWAAQTGHKHGLRILSEVHAESEIQYRLAQKGFWIYDFLLPFITLHTLIARDSGLLYKMLTNRPHNQFTMLDCHDGVPVQPDLNGWITPEQAWRVVEVCRERGARFTMLHTAERLDPQYPDVHQICGTYYDLLGRNDDAYMAARAIQFFVPGIPQIYYVGLLAGLNDEARYRAEGDDRELNRHNYSTEEIRNEMQRPVIRRLIKLIQLRNTHPAFGGDFVACDVGNGEVRFAWQKGSEFCRLSIDLENYQSTVCYADEMGREQNIIL